MVIILIPRGMSMWSALLGIEITGHCLVPRQKYYGKIESIMMSTFAAKSNTNKSTNPSDLATKWAFRHLHSMIHSTKPS